MANKREFKTYVSTVSTSLVNDMMATSCTVRNADTDTIDKAIIRILRAGENAVIKAGIKYDKTAKAFADPRQYRTERAKFYRNLFAKINSEFAKEVNAAIKEFNTAFPAEVKDELKKETGN